MLSYLIPTMLQVLLITLLTYILRKKGVRVDYGSAVGILLIALAGVSSALWGTVYQIKTGNTFGNIIREFLGVNQSISSYLIAVLFLFVVFGEDIFYHGFKKVRGRVIPIMFLKAIVFGGIEEIGWRYTFQPGMESIVTYVPATLLTFVFWGIWHIAFFYIDGSLSGEVKVPSFLLGLLTNCFILSALYAYSGSLWICVMTHALINTLSQLERNDRERKTVGIITRTVCIAGSIVLYYLANT